MTIKERMCMMNVGGESAYEKLKEQGFTDEWIEAALNKKSKDDWIECGFGLLFKGDFRKGVKVEDSNEEDDFYRALEAQLTQPLYINFSNGKEVYIPYEEKEMWERFNYFGYKRTYEEWCLWKAAEQQFNSIEEIQAFIKKKENLKEGDCPIEFLRDKFNIGLERKEIEFKPEVKEEFETAPAPISLNGLRDVPKRQGSYYTKEGLIDLALI